ncbi:MAG: hypothetical protein HZC49_07910 [Nitrospirae bacterium]|nr:hypothetical protein [Nitrospirota bacterium]
MINEITNTNDQQGQVNNPGGRHKDIQAGTQTGKSGEFDIRDVVDISQLKPVQPVSHEKNEISLSSDARNAEKNTYAPETAEGPDKPAQENETKINSTSSVYGERESGIGKFIDTVA